MVCLIYRMTRDTNILDIPTPLVAPAVSYAGLPDEAATNRIAQLHERAQACGQAFQLENFDRLRHPRGLCVGLTTSSEAIAVFYTSESGVYAWGRSSYFHVTPLTITGHWLPLPLTVGMHYWFRASNLGVDHAKAEPVGIVGPLKTHYFAIHTPPNKPATKKTKAHDDESGDSPALRPAGDESGFQPLKSLDKLGL